MKNLSIFFIMFIMLLGACQSNTSTESISMQSSSVQQNEMFEEESISADAEDTTQEIISITLSGTLADGTPFKKVFTDKAVGVLADLILDKEKIENIENISAPDNTIVAIVQDGSGTNFKLTLYPAMVPALEKEVLVIQGDLFYFYTDLQAYEDIHQLLEG